MMCCLELLGEGVMARDFDRRVADLQVEKVSGLALSLSLADVQADAAAIRTAASELATIESTQAPGMTALAKELRSAKLLVSDCRPDAVRVRDLDAAIDAANRAAAR